MFWAKAVKFGLAAAVLAVVGGGATAVAYKQVDENGRTAVGRLIEHVHGVYAHLHEDKKPDKDKLQGEWTVTDAKKNGQGPPDRDEIVGQKLTFGGDKLKFGPFEGEWTLDPSKEPRQIDLTVLEGPENEKGKVAQGIYKLDGDKLTLHLSHPGGERPTSFESKEGENCILLTTERVKKK